MPTEILAAGTTAATSSEFTVAAGAAVTPGLFRDDEGPIEIDAVCEIFRKDPDANFNPTGLVLSGINPNLTVTGAGVYHIRRPADLGYATGIQTD